MVPDWFLTLENVWESKGARRSGTSRQSSAFPDTQELVGFLMDSLQRPNIFLGQVYTQPA